MIAASLPPDETSQLRREFESVGLRCDLRETASRRSLSEIAWFVLAAVPLKPFFDKLAEDFAADAYGRLRSLVDAVGRGRQHSASPRVLLLQDPDTGVRVLLEPDLPDEAYRLLMDVDLAQIHRGPLHYDRHCRRWRSPLDEADEARSSPPSG